jgi:hypothetical protein
MAVHVIAVESLVVRCCTAQCGVVRPKSGHLVWIGPGKRPAGERPLSPGCRMQPRDSESNRGYLAGRKATWIWIATPGALKPSTSLVL